MNIGKGLLSSLLLWAVVLSLGMSEVSQTQGQESKPLPKKIIRQVVEEVVPAINSGNEIAFLNASMELIKSSSPEDLAAIDELCLEQGAEALQDCFADLVLKKTSEGIVPRSVLSDLNMSKLVFSGVLRQMEEFEKSLADHVVMKEPLVVPSDFQESEEVFWEIVVLHNEFDNLERKVQLGYAILKQHQKRLRRKNEGQLLAEKLDALQGRLTAKYNEVAERAADLRLQRFNTAHAALIDPASKENFELMLTSSMSLEEDGSILTDFLRGNVDDNRESLSRDSLKAEGLLNQVETMLASGRKSAGDVAVKANLFRNGLQYWLRGRYGAGPEVDGLVKAEGATKSADAMELLYMPKDMKKPISMFHPEEETTPGYDRRHYFTWAAEFRPVSEIQVQIPGSTGGGSGSFVCGAPSASSPTDLSVLEFADEDETFPYRIVGSYEYGTALSNLGELVDSSTPEQIEVYDKLIEMNSEYSFYSGVVSNLGLDTDPSSSEEESNEEESNPDYAESGYLKHSLAWMMALARVELGATMSMYGDDEDPFGQAVMVGGVGFGAKEYLSVLVDYAAAHLKAAQADSSYVHALKPEEEVCSSTLNHLRRTQLINDMLAKVVSSQVPEVVAVARPYAEVAQRYVDDMTKKINNATSTPSSRSSSETSRRNLRRLGQQFQSPATTGYPLE